jgi:hypothetical protein
MATPAAGVIKTSFGYAQRQEISAMHHDGEHVSEFWLDRVWLPLLIAFGIGFVLLLACFKMFW